MKMMSWKQTTNRWQILLVGVISLCIALPAVATGALAVSPTHLILDSRNRSAEVVVINRSEKPMTVRLSHRFLRPLAEGGYEEVSQLHPDEHPADALIRYAPRQMRLAPGDAQTVRMLSLKPAELDTGEYRTHLFVQQVPNGGNTLDLEENPEYLSVQLRALLAVSIPILVQHGELEARARLQDLRLVGPSPGSGMPMTRGSELHLTIHSDGNATPRGDLIAEYHPVAGGVLQRIGQLRKVSVLYPLSTREVRMPLSWPEQSRPRDGRVHLRYVRVDAALSAPFATAELRLP